LYILYASGELLGQRGVDWCSRKSHD